MLSVAELPAVTEVGFKVTVAPAGAPLAVRLMLWALPDVTAVPTVDDVELPAVTEPELGETATEKSFCGLPLVTVRV